MPKPGFKSITISESVYDKFNQVYLKNKDELVMKGVNSFAGYVTYQLEQTMQKDIQHEHSPFLHIRGSIILHAETQPQQYGFLYCLLE